MNDSRLLLGRGSATLPRMGPRIGLAVALLSMSCLGDICLREETTFKWVNSQAAGCPQSTILHSFSFSKSQCEANRNACSPDDVTKIDKYLDCLNQTLPACQPGIAQSEFEANFKNCKTQYLGIISPGCGGFQ